MPPGFQNERLAVITRDGLNDILLEPLIFQSASGKLFRAPRGGTTDGLSVPGFLQSIPWLSATGADWWSGVLHDSPYRNQLEVWDDGKQDWIPANLAREQADALIKEALETQLLIPVTPAMSFWEKTKAMTANARTRAHIQTIYTTLRAAGWKAWNDNRTPEGIQRHQIIRDLPHLAW